MSSIRVTSFYTKASDTVSLLPSTVFLVVLGVLIFQLAAPRSGSYCILSLSVPHDRKLIPTVSSIQSRILGYSICILNNSSILIGSSLRKCQSSPSTRKCEVQGIRRSIKTTMATTATRKTQIFLSTTTVLHLPLCAIRLFDRRFDLSPVLSCVVRFYFQFLRS